MTDRLFELAALDAAGALTSDEQRELRALLADAPASVRKDVALFYDSAGSLPVGLALEQPSPAVRDRILSYATKHGATGRRG